MSDPPPEHSSDDHPDRPGDDAGQISQRVQRQQVSARVPESVAPGVFASGTLVINGQHEFIIDFLQSVTRPQQVAVRVVLPPTIIPGMLRAMRQNIKLFEERFGPIPELPKPPARDNSAGGGGGGDSPPSVDEIYEQLKMSDEVAAGTYANTVMITHAPSEFCFDFIGGFYPRSVVAARVYMAAPQVPRLTETLNRSFAQYQRKIAEARRKAEQKPPEAGGDESESDDKK